MHGNRSTRAWMRKINSTDVTSWIGTRISCGSLPTVLRKLYDSEETCFILSDEHSLKRVVHRGSIELTEAQNTRYRCGSVYRCRLS